MARSDFQWVNFDHTFTPGGAAAVATRSFRVDSPPIPASPAGQDIAAVGYVLVQALDVERAGGGPESQHRIQINGTDLPAFDLPNEGGAWQTWMDRIPPGLLQVGDNRLTIRHGGNDNDGFRVANVAVHWRENG